MNHDISLPELCTAPGCVAGHIDGDPARPCPVCHGHGLVAESCCEEEDECNIPHPAGERHDSEGRMISDDMPPLPGSSLPPLPQPAKFIGTLDLRTGEFEPEPTKAERAERFAQDIRDCRVLLQPVRRSHRRKPAPFIAPSQDVSDIYDAADIGPLTPTGPAPFIAPSPGDPWDEEDD